MRFQSVNDPLQLVIIYKYTEHLHVTSIIGELVSKVC